MKVKILNFVVTGFMKWITTRLSYHENEDETMHNEVNGEYFRTGIFHYFNNPIFQLDKTFKLAQILF